MPNGRWERRGFLVMVGPDNCKFDSVTIWAYKCRHVNKNILSLNVPSGIEDVCRTTCQMDSRNDLIRLDLT